MHRKAAIKADADIAIRAVTRIRASNNILWMGLLRLAIQKAPRKAKAILRHINQNDQDITEWLRRI